MVRIAKLRSNAEPVTRPAPQRRVWSDLAARLGRGDVELTVEEFAGIVVAHEQLVEAEGAAPDPVLAALLRVLARQVIGRDDDGDHDEADENLDREDDDIDGSDKWLEDSGTCDGFGMMVRREDSPVVAERSQPRDPAGRRRYIAATTDELNRRHLTDPRFQSPDDPTGWPTPGGMTPAPIGSDEWAEEQAAIATHLACCAAEQQEWEDHG